MISDYLEWLRQRGCSPRTITLRREILGRMDRDLPQGLVSASAEELSAWIYRDSWSKATKAAYYGCARGFFTWACDPAAPRLDYDPTRGLPRPKPRRGLPKPVTDAQMDTLLDRAEEPYRLWAILAAYAGLRCIEIGQLHREHVDKDSLIVVSGKGDKPAVLPTHEEVWQAVKDLPPGPVARSKAGDPVGGRYISWAFLVYCRTIGLPGVSMHRLRHWYGTTIYQRTKDIRRTQELLRHESLVTTSVYTLITDDERRSAVDGLPTFRRER